MYFERIPARALAVVLTIVSAHLSPAWAGEIFGGRVASEVTLPGECAGNLQPAEGLPLRPALIRFSVSPDGSHQAVSCEDSSGTQAVHLRRQGEAWRKINLPEKSPLLRGWYRNGGQDVPVTATLALTGKGLWLATYQTGSGFSHPAKISNGTLYYTPLPNGAVTEVFKRPEGGQFGSAVNNVVPNRDDVVVMAGFAFGKLRTIRVTPDGKSEFLPVPTGLVPLYAAPLGPSGDYLSIDGSGKAAIGEKTVVGLPQRESVLFAGNSRAFVFPAGDNTEVHEVLPNGTVSSLFFPATARAVQPGAASSAGILVEGGGLMLDSREFSDLYLGNTRIVKTGDIVLGMRISSFVRHATAIDDNGDVYFAPSGTVSRVFRLSSPRVPSPPLTAVSGDPIIISGTGLSATGFFTELVIGGSSVGCPNPTEVSLVCKPTDGLPAGTYPRTRVRMTGPGGSVSSNEWTLVVTPPPPPPPPMVEGYWVTNPVDRGQEAFMNWRANTLVTLAEVVITPPSGGVIVIAPAPSREGVFRYTPNQEGDFVFSFTFKGAGGTTTVELPLKVNRPKTQIAGAVQTMSGEEAIDPVLPGTSLRIIGVNLASRTCESEDATGALCGTSVVTPDGAVLPATRVSPGEIVFFVPSDWPEGDVWVTVRAESFDPAEEFVLVRVAPRADPPPPEPENGEVAQ